LKHTILLYARSEGTLLGLIRELV